MQWMALHIILRALHFKCSEGSVLKRPIHLFVDLQPTQHMSKLVIHCWWDDMTARETTGQRPPTFICRGRENEVIKRLRIQKRLSQDLSDKRWSPYLCLNRKLSEKESEKRMYFRKRDDELVVIVVLSLIWGRKIRSPARRLHKGWLPL